MIDGVGLSWTTDASAADWLTERLVGFAADVGSIVPARLRGLRPRLPPARRRPLGRPRCSQRPHRPPGDAAARRSPAPPGTGARRRTSRSVGSPSDGSPPTSWRRWSPCSAAHTTTPDRAWFAFWEGYARHHRAGRAGPPATAATPSPPGTLDDAAALAAPVAEPVVAGRPGVVRGDGDRLRLDLRGRLGEPAIDDVLATPLTSRRYPARLTDGVTWDSDLLNSALDP